MSALALSIVMQLASNPACTVPGMPPAKLVPIIQVESGMDPWALHDDTTGMPYHPASLDDAERIATGLIAQGHSVGVGMSQLTPPSRFGLTVRQALEPCRNMHEGAALYARNLAVERAALCRYNAGIPNCGPRYPDMVRNAELRLAQAGTQPADADVVTPTRPSPPPTLTDLLHGTVAPASDGGSDNMADTIIHPSARKDVNDSTH